MGTGKRAACAALMLAFAAGEAGAAVSDCWSAQEVSAAKVRDMQTMMMVAGLRCRTTGTDVLASYNRFVVRHRAAITEVNGRLKAHFNAAYGQVEGARNYDRFTTALANAYGAGGSGADNCADMASLADRAAAARGGLELASLAEERGMAPDLPATRCSVAIAAR